MRIRYLKHTEEILSLSPFVVKDPAALKGRWLAENGEYRQLCLEIGCGKGKFICGMAVAHPETLFVGVEYVSTVLARAARKAGSLENVPNIRLIRADAMEIRSFFADGEADRIYLNFSDPWPRPKHAKRRLTSWRFLPLYAAVLKPDGDLCFKTDNPDLFAFSLESFQGNGWQIREQTQDLHHSPYAEGNVTTEYEENFLMNNKPIYYLRAVPVRKDSTKA